GELGWVTRGQMVKNFEDTAFSLKPGELSGVIETEYGYHIVQVEDKQTAHTQTFDEVKPQIQADLQKQIATENLKDAVDKARDEIAKNPSQAEAIAKKYGLRVARVDGLTSNGALPDANSPEVMNAVFSTSKGAVTDVINLEKEGKAAFAVVQNVSPAHNAEYAEVQSDVEQKYVAAESARLAEEAAKQAADRARKGESLETIAKPYGLPVKTAPPFTIDGAAEGIGSGALLESAFKANVGDIVEPISAQSGQFVCKVAQKIPADMSQFEKNKDSVVQSLTTQKESIQGPLFRDSIVAELKRRGKIKMNQDALNRLIGSYQS
ncbi:MAG: peptidyl-prolyl cis-trans isomerase, partial [Acidobacteriaceae bacterium]|nr:peptidyl-prolyl cis-trans isomerase [Acidobacteriaceae bacterium]